jgi:hypothetical protein
MIVFVLLSLFFLMGYGKKLCTNGNEKIRTWVLLALTIGLFLVEGSDLRTSI